MKLSRLLALVAFLCVAPSLRATHPELLVAPSDREAMKKKIETAPWAKAAYGKMKAEVDQYVELTAKDPQWLSSRLAMNWDTHYTTPVTSNSRLAGGEGKAPVPTPRFAGARDWASIYSAPKEIAGFKPFNDQGGKVWLWNNETQKEEWVDPGRTGRILETMNSRIMSVAADAGFIYWITGDEKYARLAADVLWTYMDGFSHVTAPKIEPPDPGSAKVIGTTSFEVIHEDIVTPLSIAYDFTHDYLEKQGRDAGVVQAGLKRMIDRVIAGGGAEGNWNLNQARIIAYGGLALEGNASYPDKKGRPYYVDVVLNAELPNQRGLTHVIKEGFDEETALWPEAPGYGFNTAKDLLLIATLVGNDPAGRAILEAPLLKRAVPAQTTIIYPNGWSTALGDTYHTRLNAQAAELLIAAARRSGDTATEAQVTGLLKREIADGFYDRNQQDGLEALVNYVDELRDVPSSGGPQHRNDWGRPLNILLQRNPGENADYTLAAALYGTDGGHVHANGLAIELYGAGMILAPDLGRGSSYWQADHGEYYSQPPAHNTVIPDGRATYPTHGPGEIPMKLELVEPPLGGQAASPNINFAQGSFAYSNPAVKQLRTLVLVRTGPKSGFYVDIFRSQDRKPDEGYHDYLYHGLAQSLALSDASGKALALRPSAMLGSKKGNLVGYDYFKEEKSIESAGDIRAIFSLDPGNGLPKRAMAAWMLGSKDRTIFSVSAPACHAVRDSLPALVATPMPTLVARQKGDAWAHPFVTVFEPYFASDGRTVESVRPAKIEGDADGVAACVIEGRATGEGAPRFRAIVIQDDHPDRARKIEGVDFQGSVGVILSRGDATEKVIRTVGGKL